MNKKTKKQYTKKQIVEAIAYWEKQLESGNCKDSGLAENKKKPNDGKVIELDMDFCLNRYDKDGNELEDWTEESFKAEAKKWEKTFGAKASIAIPGQSTADASISIWGPATNVRELYEFLYGGKVSDEEWEETVEEYGC